MTIIESSTTVSRPVSSVYNFLVDLNNHRQLMPDSIENWESTAIEARFAIKNMAKLAIKIVETIPNQEINIIPAEPPPFGIELKWSLVPLGNATQVLYQISADLNLMMKMLASGPLQKLADHETARLAEVLK